MNSIPVTITETAWLDIISYSIRSLPMEACGFLSGSRKNTVWAAESFHPVNNISPQPHIRFEMDPQQLISLVYKLSSSGKEIIGTVHSHPSAPANPSEHDLIMGWHHLPSHWILSLQKPEHPELRAYEYRKTDEGFLTAHLVDFTIDRRQLHG